MLPYPIIEKILSWAGSNALPLLSNEIYQTHAALKILQNHLAALQQLTSLDVHENTLLTKKIISLSNVIKSKPHKNRWIATLFLIHRIFLENFSCRLSPSLFPIFREKFGLRSYLEPSEILFFVFSQYPSFFRDLLIDFFNSENQFSLTAPPVDEIPEGAIVFFRSFFLNEQNLLFEHLISIFHLCETFELKKMLYDFLVEIPSINCKELQFIQATLAVKLILSYPEPLSKENRISQDFLNLLDSIKQTIVAIILNQECYQFQFMKAQAILSMHFLHKQGDFILLEDLFCKYLVEFVKCQRMHSLAKQRDYLERDLINILEARLENQRYLQLFFHTSIPFVKFFQHEIWFREVVQKALVKPMASLPLIYTQNLSKAQMSLFLNEALLLFKSVFNVSSETNFINDLLDPEILPDDNTVTEQSFFIAFVIFLFCLQLPSSLKKNRKVLLKNYLDFFPKNLLIRFLHTDNQSFPIQFCKNLIGFYEIHNFFSMHPPTASMESFLDSAFITFFEKESASGRHVFFNKTFFHQEHCLSQIINDGHLPAHLDFFYFPPCLKYLREPHLHFTILSQGNSKFATHSYVFYEQNYSFEFFDNFIRKFSDVEKINFIINHLSDANTNFFQKRRFWNSLVDFEEEADDAFDIFAFLKRFISYIPSCHHLFILNIISEDFEENQFLLDAINHYDAIPDQEIFDDIWKILTNPHMGKHNFKLLFNHIRKIKRLSDIIFFNPLKKIRLIDHLWLAFEYDLFDLSHDYAYQLQNSFFHLIYFLKSPPYTSIPSEITFSSDIASAWLLKIPPNPFTDLKSMEWVILHQIKILNGISIDVLGAMLIEVIHFFEDRQSEISEMAILKFMQTAITYFKQWLKDVSQANCSSGDR